MTERLLWLSLSAAGAEVQLALTILMLLVLGVMLPARQAVKLTGLLSVVTLLGVALVLLMTLSPFADETSRLLPDMNLPFHGMFAYDALSQLTKLVVVLSAAVVAMLSYAWVDRQPQPAFEFFILLLLAVLGLCLMASANNFLTLYLGLELQSLALYVLVAFRRDAVVSSEAGLKYFVLGALSSGMLLFGISLLYGVTGSVSFDGVAQAVRATGTDGSTILPLVTGAIFVLAGLAFKISAAPFHMWAPDVYQGAPTPVTAFLAAVPKIAVFALLLRLGQGFNMLDSLKWQALLATLAVASMVLGAFAAIWQKNLKRLLAYSSIGHMGYALIGLAVGTQQGASAVFYYLVLYSITTVGAFAFLGLMQREGQDIETLDDIAGLARTHPMAAYGFAFVLLSMAGLPVFVGFFAKLAIFEAAVTAGYYTLAIIGVLASAVSAFYYLRLCKVMFFDAPAGGMAMRQVPSHKLTLALSSAACLLFFVWPASVLQGQVNTLLQHFLASR